MRLIDADALFAELENVDWYNNADRDEIAERLVLQEPTIDIVPCRECKYAHMTDNGYCKYCDQWTDEDGVLIEVYHDKNFYCGYGERKDDAW